jgi:cell division septation protein DedD
VSPERDDPTDEHEQELYEDVPPRSIFAATWFRVVLVVIVLGVVGAVAVPYVLDWMNPAPPPRSAATTRSPMAPAPSTSTTPSVIDKPLADKPASEKSTSEKSAGDRFATDKPPTDKKDFTLIPAPAAPAPSTPPARPEPKPSAAPPAKAAPEPKITARATTPESKPAPETKAAPTPPAEAKSKSAMAVTEGPAKPSAEKPAPVKREATPKSETTKSETTPATETKPSAQRQAAVKATTPAPAAVGGGLYWVQVGAFKDPETAKRVATKLREENFKVEESVKRVGGSAPAAAPPAAKSPAVPSASDQYDVFVTGMSVEDLNRRLAGKGLSAETSGGGVVVKPSLPLRDAVALSKDLAVEGFKVQVRRAGGSTAAASGPTAPAAPTEGGQALHRVRIGSFSDKAAALAAARELEAKGYKPYIARGDQ